MENAKDMVNLAERLKSNLSQPEESEVRYKNLLIKFAAE